MQNANHESAKKSKHEKGKLGNSFSWFLPFVAFVIRIYLADRGGLYNGSMPPNLLNVSQTVRSPAVGLAGRSFVHPLFDYLLIGGGLSLIVTAIVLFLPGRGVLIAPAALPFFILFSNSPTLPAPRCGSTRSRARFRPCRF